MTADNGFHRVTLQLEERGGKLYLNEVRCAGYYTGDGKEHITAAAGRNMTLPTTTAKKRPRKQAA